MKPFFVGLAAALLLCLSSASAQIDSNEPYSLAKFPPQTGAERLDVYWHHTFFSPTAYLIPAAGALISQASNEPTEWHRTAEGFGKRYGTEFARSVIRNSVRDGGAAALGYETRYFRCACSGFLPRTGHAVKMTLLTYNHSGHLTLDVPLLAGAYGAGMISTTWYPDHYSPLVQGVQSGHIEVGSQAGANLLREFSPEIKRIFHIGHQ